jgi:hypothetical protein
VHAEPRWIGDLLDEAAPGQWRPVSGRASVEVVVERDPAAFSLHDGDPVTRGAVRTGRAVVLQNACGSGFDLLVEPRGAHPDAADLSLRVVARWRPPARERAAALALRSRFHLLARAVLLQYPALWQAGRRDRVPLHASGLAVDAQVLLLTGPGGVGRTTTVLAAVERGAAACSDNLVVTDGHRVHGLVEPVRVEGGGGRRMAYGRREQTLPGAVPSLAPDRIVVLRRGTGATRLTAIGPERAARVLTAATYMAGELRRYWAFAATLASGTGCGPAHPPVARVAAALADRLPAAELVLTGRAAGDPVALLTGTAALRGGVS